MYDVVGIGASVFDIMMTADRFPKEDTKIRGIESKSQCGGPCAVALIAVSKLGHKSAYIGNVGDDMYGDTIRERLAHFGVGTEQVTVIPNTQSFHSFVLLNMTDSTRTCVWHSGTAPEITADAVDEETVKNAKFLHLDGHMLGAAIRAAQLAKESGTRVSLDAGGVYPGIEELLPLVDIMIPSEEFAMKLTGEADALSAARVIAEKYGPEILIVTQGVKGGFIYKDGEEIRYPAYRVRAIDTNGAGDTFHGAFLAGLLKGYDVMGAASFASATSALKCTRFGAADGIPGTDEVLEFMKGHK